MANSDKNIRITTSKNKATFPNIVFTGSAAGTSVITLEVLDDNTVSFASNEGQIFSLDSNLSTGTIWSVNDISGVPLLRASAGATIGLAEYSGVVGIGETLPNPNIYKLEVRGQVAFGSTADTNKHFIFNTSSSAVNTNTFQLRRGAIAEFYEDGDTFKTTFRSNASQAANANYIWPVAVPATGTSVLQSDTSGNLAWVAMTAGGGSGAVSSGTAGSVAFYNTTGTTVSGASALQIATSGTAVSSYAHVDVKTGNDVRLWNSGNTFYTALGAANNASNYTLLLPSAPVGAGYSTILVDSTGQMFFAPIEGGLASTSATGNRVVLRNKMEHHVWMAAGFTPTAAGADNVIYRIPDYSEDGQSLTTFQIKEFAIRVETPSAGSSRIQIERSSTDTGAFALAATGSSLVGGLGLTISGAGVYVTSTNTFASGIFVTSGNLLRLNWTLLNATHANFSVQFTLNEV